MAPLLHELPTYFHFVLPALGVIFVVVTGKWFALRTGRRTPDPTST